MQPQCALKKKSSGVSLLRNRKYPECGVGSTGGHVGGDCGTVRW